jgi:hypothetical protein
MDLESVLLAKAAALKKNFQSIDYGLRDRTVGSVVEPLLPRYQSIIRALQQVNNDLYGDVPDLPLPESLGTGSSGPLYDKRSIDPLVSNLDYVLEVKSGYRIGEKAVNTERAHRIFLSHGQSKEWYKVQTYLEKDYGVSTLELAQEPNLGRTVLQKLQEESDKCNIAIIVMTGDDTMKDDNVRARENVMHEIGFFQGKYGLNNVILLHEEGVNIPSNIAGLVYIGFAKDNAEATLTSIARELKVLTS